MLKLFYHFQRQADAQKQRSTAIGIDGILGNQRGTLGSDVYRKIAGFVQPVPSMREIFMVVGWVWLECSVFFDATSTAFVEQLPGIMKAFIEFCFPGDSTTQTAIRAEFRILFAAVTAMPSFVEKMSEEESKTNHQSNLRQPVTISNLSINRKREADGFMEVSFAASFKYPVFQLDRSKGEWVTNWVDETAELRDILCHDVAEYKDGDMHHYNTRLAIFPMTASKLRGYEMGGSRDDFYECLSVEFERIYTAIAKECDRLGLAHNKNSKQ